MHLDYFVQKKCWISFANKKKITVGQLKKVNEKNGLCLRVESIWKTTQGLMLLHV